MTVGKTTMTAGPYDSTREMKTVPRPPQARMRQHDSASPAPPYPRRPTTPPPGFPMPPVPPHAAAPAAATLSASSGAGAVGRATALVGLLYIANRGLGLLRDVVIAGRFGTSPDLDAYYAAFRIPDFLFLVVASGAFGAAFIPIFVGFIGRGEEAQASRLASAMINLTMCALAVLSVIGFALARPLMTHVVAPGLSPDQQDLATSLTRLLLAQSIFLGLGGAAMGILNARSTFLAPALAPVTYNLGIIFGAIVLAPRFGVRGLAYGVVAGAVGHFLTQLPSLTRAIRYTPAALIGTLGIGEVAKLLVPRMFGQAIFALNFIVVTSFASRLGEGRVSAFQFGYTLFLLPHGVFALSAATVLFPRLSQLAANRDWGGFREAYAGALRGVLFFLIPASAALVALHTAIPEAVFQLGAFTSKSTDLTGESLGALATALIAYGVVEIATRAFFALRDTRTPVIAGVVTIALNLPLSFLLSRAFGLGGLALSLSVTTWLEMMILLIVLRRRVPHVAPGLVGALPPLLWATAAMCAVLAPCVWLLERLRPATGKSAAQLFVFAATLALGGVTYLGVAAAFGVPEVRRLQARVMGRLRRS